MAPVGKYGRRGARKRGSAEGVLVHGRERVAESVGSAQDAISAGGLHGTLRPAPPR
jgi:hypothetical protein